MSGQSVTLQLGTSSNYVCAHLWNQRLSALEETGNSRYSFREQSGIACPRALVVDFRDHLSTELGVEDDEDSSSQLLSSWGGAVQRVNQRPQIEKRER